jgi:hypothetical protein
LFKDSIMPFRPITPSVAAPVQASSPAPAPKAPAPAASPKPRSRIRPIRSAAASGDVERPDNTPPPSRTARKHHVVDRSGPNWDENGEYIVGKGKPPKASQWGPGQSGNPGGPKRREKVDPQTALDEAILAEFTTLVNGQPVQTTNGVFAINILKSIAATKNRLAAVDLLNLYQAKLREHHSQKAGTDLLPEEQAMINALLDTAGWEEMPAIRNHLTPVDEQEAGHE